MRSSGLETPQERQGLSCVLIRSMETLASAGDDIPDEENSHGEPRDDDERPRTLQLAEDVLDTRIPPAMLMTQC